MPLAGRSAMCVHMALLPYARPDGLGAIFCRERHVGRRAVGGGPAGGRGLGRAGACRGLVVWAACLAVTLLLAVYVYRKIGGATGDTFGAVCEIVEIVPALTLALWPLDLLR